MQYVHTGLKSRLSIMLTSLSRSIMFPKRSRIMDLLSGRIIMGSATTVFIVATGGTITTDGDFKIHTFNSSDTFTVTLGDDPTDGDRVEYLIVAGGGGVGGGTGSGPFYGGGGGAGEYLANAAQTVIATSYTITVGAGGAGGSNDVDGTSGNDSVFTGIVTSKGGGGGAKKVTNGISGGSGGGAGGDSFGNARTGGISQAGGNDGGDTQGDSDANGGGGGGGSGTIGQNSQSDNGGDGGAGTANSISGSSITYSSGGGARRGFTGSDGADGTGWSNTANRGHGGSASTQIAGSSGVVIIRYKYK